MTSTISAAAEPAATGLDDVSTSLACRRRRSSVHWCPTSDLDQDRGAASRREERISESASRRCRHDSKRCRRRRGVPRQRTTSSSAGRMALSSTVAYYCRLQLVLAAIETFAVTLTAGTCNEDQQYTCGRAVVDNRLAYLSGGGECISKPYVQFTHLCSVHNYLPSVDFCCCAVSTKVADSHQKEQRHWNDEDDQYELPQVGAVAADDDEKDADGGDELPRVAAVAADDDEKDADGGDDESEYADNHGTSKSPSDEPSKQQKGALCCRYHQDWNHFRCLDADDMVPLEELSHESYAGEGFFDLPLGVFLPALLSTLTIAICCLTCCVRCCWCSSNDQRQSLLRVPAAHRTQTANDEIQPNTGSPAINGDMYLNRSNYAAATSMSSRSSTVCVKPPLSPPCYASYIPDGDVINAQPSPDFYTVVCRCSGVTSCPTVVPSAGDVMSVTSCPTVVLSAGDVMSVTSCPTVVPSAGVGTDCGIGVASSLTSAPSRLIMPTAPGLDEDNDSDDIAALVTPGSDVIGRPHYTAMVSWPPVGPCRTRVVHPPPIYTRYATPSAMAADSSAITSFPVPHCTTDGPDLV